MRLLLLKCVALSNIADDARQSLLTSLDFFHLLIACQNTHRFNHLGLIAPTILNPLIATLKPQSNGPS